MDAEPPRSAPASAPVGALLVAAIALSLCALFLVAHATGPRSLDTLVLGLGGAALIPALLAFRRRPSAPSVAVLLLAITVAASLVALTVLAT